MGCGVLTIGSERCFEYHEFVVGAVRVLEGAEANVSAFDDEMLKDVSGQERDRGHGIRKSGCRRNIGRASLIFPLGCRCPFDCIICTQ